MARQGRNDRLAEALDEAGWTLDQLASEVRRIAAEYDDPLRTNKSAVDHWVKGAQPRVNATRYLTEALSQRLGRVLVPSDLGLASTEDGDDANLGLSVGPDAVGVLAQIWRADLDRRRFIVTSAYSAAACLLPLGVVEEMGHRTSTALRGGFAGMPEVEAVRDMIGMFMIMDERHGGQHGRSALVQYLMSDVAGLCRGRFRTEQVRAEMLSAAAVGVHLAGWKAYDAGEQGLAQRYYLQSYSLARASGIAGHDAFVFRTMSQQGMKRRRPEHCLDLAAEAVRRSDGRVGPRDTSTLRGHPRPCPRRCGQAPGCRPSTSTGARPYVGLHRRAGAVLGDVLGAGRGDRPVPHRQGLREAGERKRAEEQYARAAVGRPAETYARIFALDLVAQGCMQHSQGHLEQACSTWHRSIDSMGGVRSERTRKAVVSIRHSLAAVRSRGVRTAQDLDERARVFLSA
ncbi:hypothetical protein [Kitasatospora acidiphila]|uniref:hypothetical protein n=1 Tax=Kitasatospora acidiphila TaxID=2567942 RepID=UPI001E65895B|nr:hypothetical protein [Kitasatospora acidiphila]